MAEEGGSPKRGTSQNRRRRMRRWILAAIGLLYLVSVPWYRQDTGLHLILGLPDWVAVALGCYALAACLNCWAWLWTDVDDQAPLAHVFDSKNDSPERSS